MVRSVAVFHHRGVRINGLFLPGLERNAGFFHNENRAVPQWKLGEPNLPSGHSASENNAGQVIYASRNRFYIYSLFERKAVDCQADEFSLELVRRYLVAEPEHGTYCLAVFVGKTD